MGAVTWVLFAAGAIIALIGILGVVESVIQEDGRLFLCGLSLLIACIIMVACGMTIVDNCECVAPRECSCGYAYNYEDEISYCPDCGTKLEGYPRTNEDK
jgi:hypothetical protein